MVFHLMMLELVVHGFGLVMVLMVVVTVMLAM